MKKRVKNEYCEKVYEIVRKIPIGRVMTYGQIATILGDGYTPRTVGNIMRQANTKDLPWHRVINSKGGCSTGKLTIPMDLQRKLLEQEGIKFNDRGICDLGKYIWYPS
jgi:methylated-DNA-protein-cysteine methyltransferase-like protein